MDNAADAAFMYSFLQLGQTRPLLQGNTQGDINLGSTSPLASGECLLNPGEKIGLFSVPLERLWKALENIWSQ